MLPTKTVVSTVSGSPGANRKAAARLPHSKVVSGGGAFAPEEIGGKAEGEKDDGQNCKWSMGSWRKVERRGHEGEQKDQESQERSPATPGIESCGVVNGGDAEETHKEKEGAPDVPTVPETKAAEQDDANGEKE